MGTKVVAHVKVDARQAWAPNGESGWTVGPSPNHYRHVTIYFPATRSESMWTQLHFFYMIANFLK